MGAFAARTIIQQDPVKNGTLQIQSGSTFITGIFAFWTVVVRWEEGVGGGANTHKVSSGGGGELTHTRCQRVIQEFCFNNVNDNFDCMQ